MRKRTEIKLKIHSYKASCKRVTYYLMSVEFRVKIAFQKKKKHKKC